MKQLSHYINILELPQSTLKLLNTHSYEDMQKGLEQFKAVAKRQRKKLAMRCHPDKGGDMNKMKAINDAIDFIESIRVERRPPIQHMIIKHGSWTDSASANNSTTTSATFGWGS